MRRIPSEAAAYIGVLIYSLVAQLPFVTIEETPIKVRAYMLIVPIKVRAYMFIVLAA